MIHRVGAVAPGDVIVLVATLAAHRADAFAAASALMDYLKTDAPLWKKETGPDGTRWIDNPEIDVIISTGGTGLTGRDVTPEAVRPLFDRAIEGFEAVWHMTSFQTVGVSTMQSRACAGLANGTLIFALPGSNGACKDGWDRVIRWQLDNRHRPCNLAELLPRFTER